MTNYHMALSVYFLFKKIKINNSTSEETSSFNRCPKADVSGSLLGNQGAQYTLGLGGGEKGDGNSRVGRISNRE